MSHSRRLWCEYIIRSISADGGFERKRPADYQCVGSQGKGFRGGRG